METGTRGSMRIREKVAEADYDPNKYRRLESEGHHGQRKVQDRGLRRHARQRTRRSEAPGANSPERQVAPPKSRCENSREKGTQDGSGQERCGGGPSHRNHSTSAQVKRATPDTTQEQATPDTDPRAAAPQGARDRAHPRRRRRRENTAERLPEDHDTHEDQHKTFDPGIS